ncbi:MAG: TnpV protein [Acutalibacteraceae bacterium]
MTKTDMRITYRQVGDYRIPNLTLPDDEKSIRLGKWGMLHKDYLLNHKPVVFYTLLAQGNLWQHLADIDKEADEMFNTLVEQMKESEDITETLKDENQLEWVQRQNNIEQRATETVNEELIYC